MPPGADPHAFEPSLADRERMEQAALIIANGLGLETGLDDTLTSVAEDGTPVLYVGDHIGDMGLASADEGHDDHDDEEHDEDHAEDGHDEDEDHDHADEDEDADHDEDEDDHENGDEDHADDDHDHENEDEDEDHAEDEDDHDHDDEDHAEDGHDEDEDDDHAEDEDDHAEDEDHDHDHENGDEDHDDDHADEDAAHAEDDHSGHDHGPIDPHIWLDTLLVAELLEEISETLALEAGLDQDSLTPCVNDYETALRDLHEEIVETLSEVPPERRKLITNHDAFGYFAARYDFEVIGYILGLSTLAEPSAARLPELGELLDETSLPAVFDEHLSVPSDTLQNLVEGRPGVQIATLYTGALGPPDSEAATYLGMLHSNAMTIASVLSGS